MSRIGNNPVTVPEGVEIFQQAKLLFGPGKAANAGGVATSGLEMSQNAAHINWSREEVDAIAHQAQTAGCLVWKPVDEPYPVGYYCGIQDPDGNIIE